MHRYFHALLMGLALVFAPVALVADAPTGRVVLTVGGDLDTPNTVGGGADEINVSGLMGLVYANGYAFDDAMLRALPHTDMSRALFGGGQESLFQGPLLSDVLDAAGVAGQDIVPVALDGYQIEIPWSYITAHAPILATHADGVPLAIGKLGPTLILFPEVEDEALAEELAAMQVWATFFIGVGLDG